MIDIYEIRWYNNRFSRKEEEEMLFTWDACAAQR